jgi:transcriptional regulator NrdR family protein
MEIIKSQDVMKLLEARNIRDEEVQQVVREAEETGEKKFYHPEIGRYLASKKIGEAVYWVLYSVEESGYVIHSAYWYKSELS